MNWWTWTLIGIGAAIACFVVVVVAMDTGRRRRATRAHTAMLRDRFGVEYDRTVAGLGREAGERDLDDRIDAAEAYEVHSLAPARRDELTSEWREIQYRYVDGPPRALREAEHLVVALMEERGFPAQDAATRADAISVEEPDLAGRYRFAYGVHREADIGRADDGDLVPAFVAYRDVFELLLGRAQHEPTTQEAAPPPAPSGEATEHQRVTAA
jgi:hypothetical protein